ncbi:Glutamate receptor 4-like 3, partial [Homarus americanus]
ILVGWWLVFCLVISTGYRSSLMAHLTVQGISDTLDTFQDLLDQDGWRWSTEPWQFSGATLEYFSKNTDPVVKKINDAMEVYVIKESLEKVLEGGFSFISVKNYVKVFVSSWFANNKGETPFYISNNGIYVLLCFGWGFRKGAPFYAKFNLMISRLEDAGIIEYWTEEVIDKRVKENREAATLDLVKDTPQADTQVVLGMHHLQGAFYLLTGGSGIAFIILLLEKYGSNRAAPPH